VSMIGVQVHLGVRGQVFELVKNYAISLDGWGGGDYVLVCGA
jgi:hypothetical protein